MEWWLLRQRIETQTSLVQQALNQLVTEGRICCGSGSDGRVYYQALPVASGAPK